MKIAEINMVDYGSTGRIMLQIAECARRKGHQVFTYSKKWKKQKRPNKYHHYYGYTMQNALHVVLSRTLGCQGLFSFFGTIKLVRSLKQYKPDIVHLHNLHDSSTCLPVLFRFLKKEQIPVIWTFHDCWPFTGKCAHFSIAKCNKWKTCCSECPQTHEYPPSFYDSSKYMYALKRSWFSEMPHLEIITPSNWLKELVCASFLGNYSISVVNNGIDLQIFTPVVNNSSYEKYGIPTDKTILLGVSFGWGYKKGLDVFISLAAQLNSDYQIVLLGTNDDIDKNLPPNIISIHRTQNQSEIAELYSAADIFINATREDTFPTVNIEALACGTPVITFDAGGSPEIIDETCGIVVPCDNFEQLLAAIKKINEQKPFTQAACVRRAQMYNMKDRFNDYTNLYEKVFEISHKE